VVQPNINYGLAYRIFMETGYPRVRELLMRTLGSGLIYLNSHASDWKNPDVRPYLDRYVRGSNGVQAIDRVKLLKLLWDAAGSEFAGRHELYERNYSGDYEGIRVATYQVYEATGQSASLKGYAEACMAEYDLDGWTSDDLFNPADVTVVHPG